MYKFLLTGILRDKNRSLLPIIVVVIGVFLTITMSGWMKGIFTDMIDMNANFTSGHVRVTTRAFNENKDQMPIDLSILGVDELTSTLKSDYPDMDWVSRIRFGALLDVPAENNETSAQGTVAGTAIDFFNKGTLEPERMNVIKSITADNGSKMPSQKGEILISEDFSKHNNVKIGDKVTLIGSTMYGSMTFGNYTVCGTVRFGSAALDRGAVLMDITDARILMDMEDASAEILGFEKSGMYDADHAAFVKAGFNKKIVQQEKITPKDELQFLPQMFDLTDEATLGQYIVMAENMTGIMATVLIFVMSIVLWNTGLLGSIRRYSEYGIRLALGEDKTQIYKSSLQEAVLIGTIGSIIGTVLGLSATYYLQNEGIDFSKYIENIGGSMLIPNVYRAKVSANLYYIGFIPGLLAMVLGNALAGRGIYKRSTANLFKELDV